GDQAGQSAADEAGQGDVVVAHHRQLIGHAHAGADGGDQESHRDQVVVADHRIGERLAQLVEGLLTAGGSGRVGPVTTDHQPVAAGRLTGGAPALPVGPGVHGTGDVGDGA